MRNRLVPIIVACPMFLQNIDLFAMTVALPGMARSLHVPPLHLSAIIACYAIALAAFLPLSAWMADRFGAKRTFCLAIIVFAGASALCGTARSTDALVVYRVLQGLGAAMMVPVGRLILIRSVPPDELVVAMVWFTVPPAIGRLVGPLVGGAIITFADWRWIFFVNIPLGAITLVAALWCIERDAPPPQPLPVLDVPGLVLIAAGLGMMLGGLETIGKRADQPILPWALCGAGLAVLIAYGLYSRRRAHPVIDLGILRYRSFRTNVLGAAPFRIAISGVPFLLPLMLQVGLGRSPLSAGSVAAFSALGTLVTRAVIRRALARFSFKAVLTGGSAATAVCFAAYGVIGPHFGVVPISALVFVGGLVSSLCMVSLNTLGFVDMPKPRTSHATALLAMTQQVTAALGVVLSALTLRASALVRGGDTLHLAPVDFTVTFALLGLFALMSFVTFSRLSSGEDSGLKPTVAKEASDDE